jgi:hypothetical protein
MLRSIYGREYIWDVNKYFKAAVSNRNWAVAGAHIASAGTGPQAGAHSPAPKLGSKHRTGPEAGAHTPAPKLGWRPEPTHLRLQAFCTVHQDGWLGAKSRNNKTDGSLPRSPNPSDSAFDPHPRRTHGESTGQNPMRAAPPRASAPAPRNHPPQRWRPYQIPTPRLLPSLPPFPTATTIQHPAAEEGYRAGVELLAGGRVRLARGSFEDFITGAWRSAAPAGPASCGMPPASAASAARTLLRGGCHHR